MPNFVKNILTNEKVYHTSTNSDRAVMTAICYSGPKTAFPTNKQLFGEKRTSAIYLIDKG